MRRVPSSPRFVASVGTIERREELKGIQTGFKRGGMPLKDGETLAARLMEGSDIKSATEVMTESFRGSPDERPRARVAKYLLDQLESNPDEVCLVGVDEARGFVYFTGAADGPTQRHLYRANLWGSDLSITRLTRKDGWNTCAMDDGCEWYVCVHGSLDQTPTVEIHETSHAPTDDSCSVANPVFNFKEIVDSKDLGKQRLLQNLQII